MISTTSILKKCNTEYSEYLLELLSLWGFTYAQVVENTPWNQEDQPSVLIVPPETDCDAGVIEECLSKGGHVILIAPDRRTLTQAGQEYSLEYNDDDTFANLRLVQPLLSTFSHFPVPVVGSRIIRVAPDSASTLFENPEKNTVWAFLYEKGNVYQDLPAIWTSRVGRGALTVFAYDIVECFRNLRQGNPNNANGWRARSDCARANELFGKEWFSEFHSCNLPLADFHPMILVRIIETFLSWPVPRLWQLPHFTRSAVIVSGDIDYCPIKDNKDDINEMCSFLDSLDANMVMYLLPQNATCDSKPLQAWMDAGHRFSVHPYPVESINTAPDLSEDHTDILEYWVKEFQKRFGLPTRTVRNHRLFWEGYCQIPRIWERMGIEMDFNYGYCSLSRSYSGYFSAPPASLPIRFLDPQYKRIDVYQQPCHCGDDVSFLPNHGFSLQITPKAFEAYTDYLFQHTLTPLGVVFSLCFHPGNFSGYAGEVERGFLTKAKSHGAALLSDYEWLDFWKMRQTWKQTGVVRTPTGFRYTFKGNKSARELSLSLPEQFEDNRIATISIDGKKADRFVLDHFGQTRILVALPDGADEVEIDVTII